MNKPVVVALAAALLLALSGCSGSKSPADKEKPVATVDGRPVSRNTFNFYAEGVSRAKLDAIPADKKEELLDSLVRGELVAAEAERSGLAAQPETRAMLDLSRLEILQQASQQAYIKAHPVTEEELKAEYEVQVKSVNKTEYHARHILVATEEFARRLIDKLEKGANFGELARKESMDQGSKANDGDLGWFTPDRMVAPFAEAVKGLEPGQYTHAPVKTDFGWHVIRLEEIRDQPPPPFETVKDRLVQVVEAKKFRAHTDDLLKGAKLEKSL